MSYGIIAVVAAAAAVLSQFFLKGIIRMLSGSGRESCSTANYKGKLIPSSAGFVFIPIMLSAVLVLMVYYPGSQDTYMNYLALVLSMGISGLVDDLIGETRTKGFTNHIRSTLQGRMTTGFIKALTGLLASCIISFRMSASYTEFIVNVLIISLCANTLNLFDLRPGRAVKVFLAASVLLIATFVWRTSEALPLMVLAIAALLYIRFDLREVCMLGDTGANILGISLGFYCALLLGNYTKLTVLAVLVFINVISEKLSISDIINGSRLFSYLDNLGREHRKN